MNDIEGSKNMDNFKLQLLREDYDLELSNLMVQFLTDLDIEMLSEEKQYEYYKILDLLEEEEEMEADEPEVMEARLKKHIKKSDKAKRKKEYRKNKSKLKRQAKKYRKTSAYKKKKKKAKRMAKRGKTMTGKRQTTFT